MNTAAPSAATPATTAGTPAVKVSRAGVLAFGAVALPLSTIGLPLTIYLAPFYAGEVGLSLAALGTAMVLARILDIVVDPLIGSLSDRLPTRFGRRKPWLVLGALVLLLGMVKLFHPPQGVTLTYFLFWLGVMYVGFSLVQVPHRAWGAELSPFYDERTHISSVRQFFSTAGLIVSTLVPALVLAKKGATSADVLSALATMTLIVLPLLVLLNLYFTADKTLPRVDSPQVRLTWRAQWRAVRRNGPLRTILLVLFIGFSAETFRQTLTVFYARDVIGVPNLGLVYVYYFISAFAGVPVWRWVAKRTGKHNALALGMVVAIATNLGLFMLGRGDTALFTTMFIIKGFCFGALDLLPGAMLADATDVDSAVSRKARAGLLFAMAGVATNFGQAVGQGLSLNALSWIGYRAAGETSAEALTSLKMLYALAPSAVLALAMVIALRYTLTAPRHERLRQALSRRLTASAGRASS
ncbi:MAG TPA: MFS transporter [Rubrivivax sp.]|nr:MFS transporter [Rubrivivax sp.]